jgi:D-alanyl-D-alanine carboxypeptidase/D-alanyl-D-alanine-endopeptidase (penicillin-binding protein 4)
MLHKAGIATQNAAIVDGSGLSRENACTPRQLAEVLAWARRQPWAAALHDNLSQAGVDGSLKKRLKESEGAIFAKTGTMRGIRALAGYVDGASGPRYAFAIIFNRYTGPSTPYKAIQDKFCRVLLEAVDAPAEGPRAARR